MKIKKIYKEIKKYVDLKNKQNAIIESLDKKLNKFKEEKIKIIEEKFLEKFNKKPNISMYKNFFNEQPIVFNICSLDGVYFKEDGTFVSYSQDFKEETVDFGISQEEIIDFIEKISKELNLVIKIHFEETLD